MTKVSTAKLFSKMGNTSKFKAEIYVSDSVWHHVLGLRPHPEGTLLQVSVEHGLQLWVIKNQDVEFQDASTTAQCMMMAQQLTSRPSGDVLLPAQEVGFYVELMKPALATDFL